MVGQMGVTVVGHAIQALGHMMEHLRHTRVESVHPKPSISFLLQLSATCLVERSE